MVVWGSERGPHGLGGYLYSSLRREEEGFGLHNMTGLVDNFVRDILSLTMNNGARENGTILGTCMVDWAV